MSAGSRLRRFLQIERRRPAVPEREIDDTATRRFGGVLGPGGGPGAPSGSGADLDRFAPPPPPPLELAASPEGARPFTRCMRCGTDHHVSATECAGCGARLDTTPQRAFNEDLWRARREEAAREDGAAAERRARADAEARALGEALAVEVGDAERRRLDAELGGPDASVWGALRRLLGRLAR